MGPNALPALPNPDPVIGRKVEVEMGLSLAVGSPGPGDQALAPTFRILVPFREIAALEVDGAPAEVFSTSASTRERLGIQEGSGLARGDLRFGARFLVLPEGDLRPAVGLRFVVKSTTGKQVEARRFTNSPAYTIDAILGKDAGRLGAARLRVLAKLGFFAWQQGNARQDDAIDYGLTLRAALPRGALALEWRGYAGWRGHDRPMLMGLTGSWPLATWADAALTVNRGITGDAPPWEVRGAFVTRFDVGLGR
jgi:hypothetical protein